MPDLAWIRSVWDYELLRTDWSDLDAGRLVYVLFNALEALAWLGFACFVCWRALRLHRSGAPIALPWHALYAAAFLLFCLSDLIELDVLTVSLLLFKAAVFALIVACRAQVVSGLPGARY